MSVVDWGVIYYRKKPQGSYNPNVDDPYEDPVALTDYRDVKLNLSIGDGKDAFSLVFSNYDGYLNNVFRPNDKLLLLRKLRDGDSFSDEDVLMNGSLNNDPLTHSYNAEHIKASGFNHSQVVMSALAYVDANNLPIDVAIQDSLTFVNFYNRTAAKLYWHPDNPSVNLNDDSFPVVGEKFFYKPIKYILDKYSSKDRTGDGTNYYWYVDKDNFLIWRPRTEEVKAYFDSEGDDYYQLVVKKNLDGVKNYVIVKGGIDPDGNTITNYVPDYASIANVGFRYHILVDENKKSLSLREDDLKRRQVIEDDDSLIHIKDASFPFSTDWSQGVVFANYRDYVAGFREYIKEDLRVQGQSFIDARKYGRLEVEVYKRPDETVWALGDVIACNIPQVGDANKLLRVEEISYGTEQDMYVLREDDGSIGTY
jgi:hypothetical protein